MQQSVSPPLHGSEDDVERWNNEWVEYLRQEWMYQFVPYTEFPEKPPLPDDPMKLLHFPLRRVRLASDGRTLETFGHGWELAIYCDRDALLEQRVMELGCGCGNLGKLLCRYARSYLGTDFSTLALAVARLVSPMNCTYHHVSETRALQAFARQIDTVISRYFWIHQNLELGRRNLEFLEPFLRLGGRAYLDFFWPDPAAHQFITFPAGAPLSQEHPSAQFWYTSEDVQNLISGMPFRLLRECVSVAEQRRFVVLEKI